MSPSRMAHNNLFKPSQVNALKDSSLLYDDLDVDQDFNCDAHFETAMRHKKPSDVVIVHCDYWSVDHPNWMEYAYSFEIEKNDSFLQELIEYNQMVPLEDQDEIERQKFDWFLPGKPSRYEGYYTEDDFDDFQVFRDRKTGNLFVRGSQS